MFTKKRTKKSKGRGKTIDLERTLFFLILVIIVGRLCWLENNQLFKILEGILFLLSWILKYRIDYSVDEYLPHGHSTKSVIERITEEDTNKLIGAD